MALIEQLLERKLADHLLAVFQDPPEIAAQVHCSWDEWQEGETADTGGDGKVVLYVTVQPRSYPEWISPVCTFEVSVGIVFPWELFPDRAGIAEITRRVFARLEAWQISHSTVQSDLSLDNLYQADGFRLSGGRRVDNSADSVRATVVTQTLSVMGIVLEGEE